MRINKFVASSTGLSRRTADTAIAAGKVLVNGVVPSSGYTVQDGDRVTLNNRAITPAPTTVTIMMNKPVGYVVSRNGQGSPTIYSLLPLKYHTLKPVGRLDKNSSGLLLLTNDGDLANELTHPSRQKVKVYEIALNKPLEPLHQQMISDHGVQLEDGLSQFSISKIDPARSTGAEQSDAGEDKADASEPRAWRGREAKPSGRGRADSERSDAVTRGEASLSSINETALSHYQITMREGRNRQIRRTFGALGYDVIKLHRTQFGPYTLTIPPTKIFENIN